jgi:hypothetical protein
MRPAAVVDSTARAEELLPGIIDLAFNRRRQRWE